MKRIIQIMSILAVIASACSSSAGELQATRTRVAADVVGTQTAQAPPPTATEMPEPTLLEETTAAETTVEALPPVTATPWTEQPLASDMEEDLLCYQAAVLVYADWSVHDMFLHPYRPRSNLYGNREQAINHINLLNWYRGQRPLRIIEDKGEATIINDVAMYPNRTYYLNGEELSHCQKIGDVIFARSSLGYHPWLPEGWGPTKSPPPPGQSNQQAEATIAAAMAAIERTVRSLRYQLLVGEGIDYRVLMDVERPIWEDARNNFGIDLPAYLQGQEVIQ